MRVHIIKYLWKVAIIINSSFNDCVIVCM